MFKKIRWNLLPGEAENRFSGKTVLYFMVECVDENYTGTVDREIYFEYLDFWMCRNSS